MTLVVHNVQPAGTDVRSKPQQDCQQAKGYARADSVLHHRQCSNWRCFRKTFLLTHKFGTAWAIDMTANRKELSELPICATTATSTRSGTSVIRRSSVPPRAWVGLTTYRSQPETVVKSKPATPWRFVVVESNHSWWWPFKSPTNRKEAWTSSACTAAIDASKQSRIRSSRSWLR